jgi:hypothetical protein
VHTSDQPSFISVYFSPLTSDEALRASDISPMPSRNLQPNTHGGTAKKITNSPYKKFVGGKLRKRKSKRPLNPKPIGLRRMPLLGPSKRGTRRFARIQLRLTFHKIRTLTELFLSSTIRRKKGNNTPIVCCVLY